MKRLFLILCLITICNISYADIASVGYVDSVADTKQDTITDIETIRTGAAAGATAVQPSSLSTVATSGSYNDLSNKPTIPTTISSFTNDSGYITTSYHDSTKQDKLPNGPTVGIYKLVWNSNLKQFIFQKESDVLTCSSGTYNIGFDQCIDPTIEGTSHTYSAANMTWKTVFPYGNVSGVAVCNDTSGSSWGGSTTVEMQETGGVMCWCKMTHPAVSLWVFGHVGSSSSDCADFCVAHCGSNVRTGSNFRSGVFSSVGQ